jgi:hypothetical protein
MSLNELSVHNVTQNTAYKISSKKVSLICAVILLKYFPYGTLYVVLHRQYNSFNIRVIRQSLFHATYQATLHETKYVLETHFTDLRHIYIFRIMLMLH